MGGSLFLLVEQNFPGWQATLPVAATALLIAAGPDAVPNRKLLANGVLPALGLVSYSAYLWHWPILVYARYQRGGELPAEMALALTAGAVAIATASTKFIERPFRSGGSSRSIRTAPALVAAMVVAGARRSLAAAVGRRLQARHAT